MATEVAAATKRPRSSFFALDSLTLSSSLVYRSQKAAQDDASTESWDHYVNTSNVPVTIVEKAKQFMAELSLARAQIHYPTEIQISDHPESEVTPNGKLIYEALFDPQSRADPHFIERIQKLVGTDDIDSVLASLTREHKIPMLHSNLSTQPVPFVDLLKRDPRSLEMSDIVHIIKRISSGTYQSVVYQAKILPNDSGDYHYQLRDGVLAGGIDAAVKNAPLVPPSEWKDLLRLMLIMKALSDPEDKTLLAPDERDFISKKFELYNYLPVPAAVAQVEKDITRLMETMAMAFSNPLNDAYVDCFALYLGNKLSALTPIFPLMYGSFITRDASFLGNDISLFAKDPYAAVPVQSTVIQLLDETFDALLARNYFTDVATGRLHEHRMNSALVQLIAGLSVAQEKLKFTHGDLHVGNFVVKFLPTENSVMYIRCKPSERFKDRMTPEQQAVHDAFRQAMGDQDIFLRIPLFGIQYHMIDFGFSSFDGTLIDSDCYSRLCGVDQVVGARFNCTPIAYRHRRACTDAFSADLEAFINNCSTKVMDILDESDTFAQVLTSINKGPVSHLPFKAVVPKRIKVSQEDAKLASSLDYKHLEDQYDARVSPRVPPPTSPAFNFIHTLQSAARRAKRNLSSQRAPFASPPLFVQPSSLRDYERAIGDDLTDHNFQRPQTPIGSLTDRQHTPSLVKSLGSRQQTPIGSLGKYRRAFSPAKSLNSRQQTPIGSLDDFERTFSPVGSLEDYQHILTPINNLSSRQQQTPIGSLDDYQRAFSPVKSLNFRQQTPVAV